MVYNISIDFVNAAREGLICFPKQSGHLAPNPDDCSSFLLCNNERYLKTDCPKSLHFDPKRKTCNFPERIEFKGNCRVNPLVEETGLSDYIDYGNGYEYEEGQFDNGQFINNGNGNDNGNGKGNGNDIAEYENNQDASYYDDQDDSYYDDDDSYYDDEEYEYYDDDEYENDEEYVQDYEKDYQNHKNQVDTAYGLDGSPCSPEGKLTVNPNDCSSFLMCNHKKYMVRPCQDGLLWDPQYSICNRAQNIQQEVQCKLLEHKGSVSIEKLQTKKSKSKKKMAAMRKLGKNGKRFLAKKAQNAKRPQPQRRPEPQPRQESRPLSRSESGPNLDFKFFKPLF